MLTFLIAKLSLSQNPTTVGLCWYQTQLLQPATHLASRWKQYEAGTFEPGLQNKKLLVYVGRPQNSFEPHLDPENGPEPKKAQNDPKIWPVFHKSIKLVLLSQDYKTKVISL